VQTRASLRPIALTFLCFGAFWGAWAVSVADVKAFLDVSDGGFGLVLSAALLAAVVANAVAGSLAERWGTQLGLARGLIAWSVFLVAGALVHSQVVFAVLLVGIIAAGGAVDVVMNVAATAALAAHPGRLVRFHALFNAGACSGALLTAVVSRAGLSWRWVWVGAGIMALVLSHACRRVDLPAGTVGARHGLFEAFRTVRREHLMLLALVFATSAMVEGGIDTWGVLFLREHLSSGLLVGAAAYVVGQGIATAARVTLGPAAGSLGARRGVALGAGLTAAGLAVMALVDSTGLAWVGLVIAAGGISVCWPLLLSDASARRERPALVVGGVTSIGYLGFVFGPIVVGWLADTFGLDVGLLFLAVAACFVAVTPSRRGRDRSRR